MITSAGWLLRAVALTLCGDATDSGEESPTVRFGDIEINLETGRYYNFDTERGGDALDLVRKVKGLKNGSAEAWLEEQRRSNDLFAPPGLPAELAEERDLLGMALCDRAIFAVIDEEIVASDFALPLHGALFSYLAELYATAAPFDAAIAAEALGGAEPSPGFTLPQYLARIAAEAPFLTDQLSPARRLAREIATLARGDFAPELLKEAEDKPFVSRFGYLAFEDLDAPGPEHSYLIDDILTVGDKSIIGGASGSGKSFLAIHAAACIAVPMPFFGHKIMAPGLVVYQAGEGARAIKKRFRAWRQYFGIERGQRLPIAILQKPVDLYRSDGDAAVTALIEEIKGISRLYDVPLRAVFIDTLAKATPGADENSGKDMSAVLANVDRVSAAFPECNVSLVHHFNAAGTKLRGHSSIYANIDQVILVTKDEETKIRTALLDKQKDGEDSAEIKFELFPVQIGTREADGEPITSCVTLPIGAGRMSGGRPALALSDQHTIVLRALQTALNQYGEPPPAALMLPASITRVTTYKRWLEEYRKVSTDEKENTVYAAMKRAGERMLKLRVIGRINPYVWLTGRAVAGVNQSAAARLAAEMTTESDKENSF